MIGLLAKFVRASNLFKIIQRYFGKVWRKSNVCIIQFYWLIAFYLCNLLPCNTSFPIVKKCCVREEVSDAVFFFRHNFNRSMCENIFLVSLHVRPLPLVRAPPPTDTFPFTYDCPSVSIIIRYPLNWSPIYTVDNFQRFQCQIYIFNNYCWRRCSHFQFPYTF